MTSKSESPQARKLPMLMRPGGADQLLSAFPVSTLLLTENRALPPSKGPFMPRFLFVYELNASFSSIPLGV